MATLTAAASGTWNMKGLAAGKPHAVRSHGGQEQHPEPHLVRRSVFELRDFHKMNIKLAHLNK